MVSTSGSGIIVSGGFYSSFGDVEREEDGEGVIGESEEHIV